jgi:hypothetical protein
MDGVSFVEPSRQPSCGGTEGRKHTMIGRVPIANRGGGAISLAIVGNPENDGRPPPWQGAIGHEISARAPVVVFYVFPEQLRR